MDEKGNNEVIVPVNASEQLAKDQFEKRSLAT